MEKISNTAFRGSGLERVYPEMSSIEIEQRLGCAAEGFESLYGKKNPRIFTAPGRTELCGNHTDHQRGRVIAAAVGLDDVAAALPNGGQVIRVFSDTHGDTVVETGDFSPRPDEAGTPASLIRGVAEYFEKRGYGTVGGFDAYVSGLVPVGLGLSSSAAFEVLIASVMNGLFFGGELPAFELARAGQYAENAHFGKPCGLMDQTASAVGGIVGIDFENPEAPKIERLSLDFSDFGYTLCIIDTGEKHDSLRDEYAAIPAEMTSVAGLMGADKLRDIPPECFYEKLPELRKRVSDRALLRAMHFFGENDRVTAGLDALRRKDFNKFLKIVQISGRSSWVLLQNIYPRGAVKDQPAALALAWCERLLCGKGASRIHGGGFGGTIQAFVPADTAGRFKTDMERLTGPESCRFFRIRDCGAAEIIL